MTLQPWAQRIRDGKLDDTLAVLYGTENVRKEARRLRSLLYLHQKAFPTAKEIRLFSAPGRSEIAGNHTDHQHGRVLAAAVSLDIVAAVTPVPERVITIKSVGFAPFRVDISSLAPISTEENSSLALVRGVAAGISRQGYNIGGFCASLQSEVPRGSGLSSSAAFSVLIGTILSCLYNGGRIPSGELAIAGQISENEYFGKPSGRLDQLASASGGFTALDFADASKPQVTRIALDVSSLGYAFVIVNPGGSHAGLTNEYASIPHEMQQVAAYFGKQYLREVDASAFYAALPELRKTCADRAILRAMHYFDEDARVVEMTRSLADKDVPAFLAGIRSSGESSFMLLQNVCPTSQRERSLALALALSARLLKEDGAWRVHGGGFAGTILALVPMAQKNAYCAEMERIFSKNCCYPLRVRPCGGMEFLP